MITDREQRSDQRRPQVQLRVVDAADAEIGDQRLGDEPQLVLREVAAGGTRAL